MNIRWLIFLLLVEVFLSWFDANTWCHRGRCHHKYTLLCERKLLTFLDFFFDQQEAFRSTWARHALLVVIKLCHYIHVHFPSRVGGQPEKPEVVTQAFSRCRADKYFAHSPFMAFRKD